MTGLTATLDTRELEKALLEAQRKTDMDMRELVKMQARLLMVRVMEFTRPLGKGAEGRKKGQANVVGDVRRVFTDFDGFEFKNPGIKKAWNEGDKETLDRVFRASPALSQFTLLTDVIPGIHQGLRIRGAVRKRMKPRYVIMDSGRRRGAKKINDYAKQVQKRVGRAKKGWLAGADFARSRIPAWVRKAAPGENEGAVSDTLSKPHQASITAVNKVPYASHAIDAGSLQAAVDTRARDLLRWAEKLAKARLKKALR